MEADLVKGKNGPEICLFIYLLMFIFIILFFYSLRIYSRVMFSEGEKKRGGGGGEEEKKRETKMEAEEKEK